MQLAIDLQDVLTRFGYLEEHMPFVFLIFVIRNSEALDIVIGRFKFASQDRGNGQTLPVEHDDSLPVIEPVLEVQISRLSNRNKVEAVWTVSE